MMDIVMTGAAGLAWSRQIAALCLEEGEALFPEGEELCLVRRRLPRRLLRALAEDCPETGRLEIPGARCLTPVEEGGLWTALWRLADAASEELGWNPAGLHVLQRDIPIRQETIEICELLERDPYRIPSGGWLFLLEDGWNSEGRVIGRLTRSRARIVQSSGGIRYLERPRR